MPHVTSTVARLQQVLVGTMLGWAFWSNCKQNVYCPKHQGKAHSAGSLST